VRGHPASQGTRWQKRNFIGAEFFKGSTSRHDQEKTEDRKPAQEVKGGVMQKLHKNHTKTNLSAEIHDTCNPSVQDERSNTEDQAKIRLWKEDSTCFLIIS
jgi:hypothetical protein